MLGAIVLCTNARVLNEGDINFDALRTVEHIPFATYGLPEGDFSAQNLLNLLALMDYFYKKMTALIFSRYGQVF